MWRRRPSISTLPRKLTPSATSRMPTINANIVKRTSQYGSSLPTNAVAMLRPGDLPPRPDAATTELRADRVSRGYRDHHVEHGRQHRPQQERGVTERRVGQDVFLGQQSRRRLLRLRDGHRRGRDRGGRRGHGVADALRSAVAGREVLRVVIGDRTRPATGQQILLEVRRQVDRGDRLSRLRIALAAAPRSSARLATAMPGAAATVWMNIRDIAEWSISTTTTPRPRTTAELNVSPSSAKAITGTPNSRKPAT